ncbi:MAG: hypothetical protein RBS88_12830 [Spongiibacteraceae bacterium]|jgi:hypothetical protein|nr:hypothetical protein [Spongiibacteraceae bacterium]
MRKSDSPAHVLATVERIQRALQQAVAMPDWDAVARLDLEVRALLATAGADAPALRSAMQSLASTHGTALRAAREEREQLQQRLRQLAEDREAVLAYGQWTGDGV